MPWAMLKWCGSAKRLFGERNHHQHCSMHTNYFHGVYVCEEYVFALLLSFIPAKQECWSCPSSLPSPPLPSPLYRCWLPTLYLKKNMPRSALKLQQWTSAMSLQRPSGEYIMENPCHSSSRMYQWKIKKRNCQSPSTLCIHIPLFCCSCTHTQANSKLSPGTRYRILNMIYYLLSQTLNGHEMYIPTSKSVYHQ